MIHVQVIGSPIINVTVWSNNLEYQDESIAFEMNHGACG
jgi:hypothetical protein